MTLIILLSPFPFVYGQPQGYVLIYSPPRAYNADWMDVKAVYMKEEGDKLYFYIEYYGAIPSSEDYERHISIYIDVDRNPQTGDIDRGLGVDYTIDLYLSGDNSEFSAELFKWNNTSRLGYGIKELTPNVRTGLNYMEVWVDKRDIGYTQKGIDFYIYTSSGVRAIRDTELNYVIGSSVKEIKVDGDSNDWGSVSPLITFPPRSINPPELEVSSIYVANDDENLYFRIDTRGKPTMMVNGGTLYRVFYVYLDTDNNDSTGDKKHGGAEFIITAFFKTSLSKRTYVEYSGYDGQFWYEIGDSAADFNNIFEFKVPLSFLELGSGQTIGIHIEGWGRLVRYIPQSGYLTYYPNITPSKPSEQQQTPPSPPPQQTPEQKSPVTKTSASADILYLLPILLLAIPLVFIYRRRSKERKEEEIVRILLSE